MKKPGDKSKHLGFRFDRETHYKFYYIAAYEGRSGSAQLLHLIQTCIRNFERENGPIPVPEETEKPD